MKQPIKKLFELHKDELVVVNGVECRVCGYNEDSNLLIAEALNKVCCAIRPDYVKDYPRSEFGYVWVGRSYFDYIEIHYDFTDGTEISYKDGKDCEGKNSFNTNCLDFFVFGSKVRVIKRDGSYIDARNPKHLYGKEIRREHNILIMLKADTLKWESKR